MTMKKNVILNLIYTIICGAIGLQGIYLLSAQGALHRPGGTTTLSISLQAGVGSLGAVYSFAKTIQAIWRLVRSGGTGS